MKTALGVELRGTGAFVPADILDNEYFSRYLDTSDEWIVTRTGIHQRRRAGANESTSTMAVEASRRAIADAAIDPTEIDLILCATATPDYAIPPTAPIIQEQIGAVRAAAFDVSAACAGFLYGSAVAFGMLQTGVYRRVLVIGAETLTRVTDYEDRSTAILFGDGAGAAIYAPAEKDGPRVLFIELGTDGSHAKDIWMPGGGSRLPSSTTTVAERLHFMKMKGREVYKFAVSKMMDLIDRALESTGLSPNDLKLVIPHQSNLRIIESVREKLGLPQEKIAVNIDQFGNTSAASVIMALDAARRDGTLRSGDHIMMLAIGAGLTWGAVVMRL